MNGILAITNSAIVGNIATGDIYGGGGSGGGILSNGELTLDTCTVASNYALPGPVVTSDDAFGWGGGIFQDFGTLIVVRCTVSGNIAERGEVRSGVGGGVVNGRLAILVDSTISGNIARGGVGGGVECSSYTSTGLDNCTVVDNGGGGLYNVLGFVAFKNTIVAANSSGADVGTGPHGSEEVPPVTLSVGFNVIGSTSGPVIAGTNDQLNVSADSLRLGPLGDNGGPTFTHQLLCGSVAINAGDNSDAPPTDQRGFPRIMGGTIDIGAYESGNQPGEVVNADGCSIADLSPCEGMWRNHGQYVECVAQQTAAFVAQDLMTEAARGRAIRAAAHSDCGKR